jgi:hypothetical protein
LAFNYPYLLIGLGAILILLILTIILFGKNIRTKYRLYLLKKRHGRFITQFNEYLEGIKKDTDAEVLEEVLVYWKRYMEGLEEQPFTKLTSRELLDIIKENNLYEALKEIDRAIYGGTVRDEIHTVYEELVYYTNQAYDKKVNEISHG